MNDKLFISEQYTYDSFKEVADQNKRSLSSFWKDLAVENVLSKDDGAKVYDTGEVKYVKDIEYGLGYFPTNAFELLDMTVHLPISNFFASEFIPMRVGGGAVEMISAFRSNLSPTRMQLASGEGNSIPLVNAKVSKYSVPVRPYEAGIKVGKLDMYKAEQGNYSIIAHREEALRMSYWYEIETKAFIGNIGIDGITDNSHANFIGGLLNQPSSRIGGIIESNINSTDTNFSDLKVENWLTLFANVVQTIKTAVRLNRQYLPNRFLVYPEVFAILAKPATLGTGAVSGVIPVFASILDYLEKELSKLCGTEVKFGEIPYTSPTATANGYPFQVAGTNTLGRIVVYRQDADMFTYAIPMPLTLSPMVYSASTNAYHKHALTFLADGLLIHRPQTIWYVDNVATGE